MIYLREGKAIFRACFIEIREVDVEGEKICQGEAQDEFLRRQVDSFFDISQASQGHDTKPPTFMLHHRRA